MVDTETLQSFFGWCLVVNTVIMMFSFFALMIFRNSIKKIHSDLMDVEQKKLPDFYFDYLAKYKIAILVFNLSPYIALSLI